MDLTKKITAIVVFKGQREEVDRMNGLREGSPSIPVPRLIYYQVTLDPNQISPSGGYIRLGDTQGDEILGWQPIDSIEIIETLAYFEGEQIITIPKEEKQ